MWFSISTMICKPTRHRRRDFILLMRPRTTLSLPAPCERMKEGGQKGEQTAHCNTALTNGDGVPQQCVELRIHYR